MIQKISIDIPEGYEFVKYGPKGPDDLILWNGVVCNSGMATLTECIIVKRSEPERWRANEGEYYYTVSFGNDTIEIVLMIDRCYSSDSARWDRGNYFQTRDQAKGYLMKLVEAL